MARMGRRQDQTESTSMTGTDRSEVKHQSYKGLYQSLDTIIRMMQDESEAVQRDIGNTDLLKAHQAKNVVTRGLDMLRCVPFRIH